MISQKKSSISQEDADQHASLQLQEEELNKSPAILMQQEELNRLSGEKQRPSCSVAPSIHSPVESSESSDPEKHPSSSRPADASVLLYSPPPSYFGQPTFNDANVSNEAKATNNVASFQPGRSNYHGMLLKDLRYETRRQLGLRLDIERPTAANWKSVADEIGFSNLEIQNYDATRLKTELVLNETEIRFPTITVGDLCGILENLERHDVITDMGPWFERDWNRRGRNFASMSTMHVPCSPSNSASVSRIQQPTDQKSPIQEHKIESTSPDSGADWCPSQQSSAMPVSELPSQRSPEPIAPTKQYDAFVLYDNADREFILKEFLPKIETQAGMSLFLPDRDLNVGAQTYHAQLEAMLVRCSKLVVILSDEFLRSSSAQWALSVAVGIDPAAKQQKIIPVIYKQITVSNILAGINACNRTRVLEDSWFWDNLYRSLMAGRQKPRR